MNAVVTVVSLVLSLVSALAGSKWLLAKKKAVQLTTLLTDLTAAVEDGKITEAEGQRIVADAKAFLAKE
jgi:hypothetical protein